MPTDSSGGKGKEVRAGGAYVEVSLRDRIGPSLAKIKDRLNAFADGLIKVGKGAMLIGAGALAPFAALFVGGVDRAAGIHRLAQEMGFTIEQMQRLQFAADVAGKSIDEILENPARFKDLLADAPILDDKSIRAAAVAQQEWRKSIISLQSALTPLVQAFAPILKSIAEFLKNNPGFVVAMAVGAGAIFGFGLVATTVGLALKALTITVTLLGGAIGFLASPFGIAILAVGGLAAAFLTLTKEGRDARGKAADAFAEIGEIGKSTWHGLKAAFASGDLVAAAGIVGKGLTATWKATVLGLTHLWIGFKDWIVGLYGGIIDDISKSFINFWAWLQRNDPTGLLSGDRTDEEINNERDQMIREIDNLRKAEDDARRRFRDGQIAAARKDLDDAKADLEKLNADAIAAAAGRGDFAGLAKQIQGAFRLLGGTRTNAQFSSQRSSMEELQREANIQLGQIAGGVRDMNRNWRFG